MPRLIMHGSVYRNSYNEREMFASISYGTLESPCDQNGIELTGPSTSFDNHLINNVVPYLKIVLLTSNFTIENIIDYPYSSTLPAIILRKKSNSATSEDEINELTILLTNAINSINKRNNEKGKSSTLFNNATSSASAAAMPQPEQRNRNSRR